jgi:hypothetical protein
MIKGWKIFNESTSGGFTDEMAQEIVYYFSEDSKPSKEISSIFFGNPEVDNLFNFYESGYEEYKAATQKLYGEVNRGSLEFRDSMLKVYELIRLERKAFPTVAELEDIFLDAIDDGYGFVIYSSPYQYEIRIEKYDDSVENFIKYTKSFSERSKRLNVGGLKSTLSKAERLNGFYNRPEGGKDTYELNDFKIEIRRSGWNKSNRDGSWSPTE